MKTKNQHIILFDGVCNLCNSIVKYILKRDNKSIFKFASLQSEFGIKLLKRYNLPVNKLDTFVYIRKDKAYTRSSAGLYVMLDLGKIWKLLFSFIIFPKFFRDYFYNIIARSRYRIWGKSDSCILPTPETESRFITN